MRLLHPTERAFLKGAEEALASGPIVLLSPAQGTGSGCGLLVCAADGVSDATVNLMAREARGVVALALDELTAFRLGLRLQAANGGANSRRRYLRSIEATACAGTGISAADRALTMRAAGDPKATAADLVVPGHIMPLVVPTPVTASSGLPDLAYQLVKAATGSAVAGWCDILDENGACASSRYCEQLGRRLGLPVIHRSEVPVDGVGPDRVGVLGPVAEFEMLKGWA